MPTRKLALIVALIILVNASISFAIIELHGNSGNPGATGPAGAVGLQGPPGPVASPDRCTAALQGTAGINDVNSMLVAQHNVAKYCN